MKLITVYSLVLGAARATARQNDQSPLREEGVGVADFDLIYEQASLALKKAEIIPTVINTFKPFLIVNVTWPKATAEYGNTVNPSKTQDMPKITFIDSLPNGIWSKGDIPQLTLAMSDPDAPSRDNPEWSEICHWIATDISLSTSGEAVIESKDLRQVMPYKPPGPPPKTGKHRYVFVALAPVNGTTEKLHLKKPGDRQHWGYEKERQGLRMWAEEMGLGVVGANFIYEQNDKQ